MLSIQIRNYSQKAYGKLPLFYRHHLCLSEFFERSFPGNCLQYSNLADLFLASTDIGAPFLNKIITITAGSKFFIPRDKSHRCNKGTKSILGKLNHMYMILSNGISHIKHMVSRIFFLNIGIFSVLYVLIIIIVIYLGA